MRDDEKTKEQLIAELRGLRRRLNELDELDEEAPQASPGTADGPGEKQGAERTGLTRREVLRAAWIAPVVLTISSRPETVFGQSGGRGVPATAVPTYSAPFPTSVCPPTQPNTVHMPTLMQPTGYPTPALYPTTHEPTQYTQMPTTAAPTTSVPTTMMPTSPPPTDSKSARAKGGLRSAFPTVDRSAFRAGAKAPTAAEDLFRFES